MHWLHSITVQSFPRAVGYTPLYLALLPYHRVHSKNMHKACDCLTHWGGMSHICFSKLYHHWFREWLVAWQVPSHYLNQCWIILNWTHGNKLHWNLNGNLYIFIQENAFENVVREFAVILSRPQCVNSQFHPYPSPLLYTHMTASVRKATLQNIC